MVEIKTLIALLEAVMTNAIPANDALNRWPGIHGETEDAAAQAWDDLAHYASD